MTGEKFDALLATAKTWGRRPSELLGMEDDVLALAFDLAGTRRAIELAKDEGDETVTPGERVFL